MDMSGHSRMIELYREVNSVPYAFSVPRNPDLLFQKNKGICSEKNMFLAKQFHDMGIPVRFVLMYFDWNAMPVPKELVTTRKWYLDLHLAIQVNVDGRWLLVDATWDPALKAAGLEMTENWDGMSDTKIGVPALGRLPIPFIAYQPFKLLLRVREKGDPAFQRAFNEYVQKIRGTTPAVS